MMLIAGLATSIYILILVIYIAIAVAEGILVRRGKKKYALFLILAVFILITLFSLSSSTVDQSISESKLVVWVNNTDEEIGEVRIVTDENDNVLGFGMLKITTGNTPKYLKLEYNDDGELIGEEDALQYKDALNASLNETSWKILRGTSMDNNQLEVTSERKGALFEPKLFIRNFFVNNIWTVILILIYLFFSYRNNNRKKKSIDSIKIQDL